MTIPNAILCSRAMIRLINNIISHPTRAMREKGRTYYTHHCTLFVHYVLIKKTDKIWF